MNNPKTDCAEYIKKLIAAASIGGKAYSDDPMRIYQRVQDQAGFKLRNHEFSGTANREGNKRVVYIDPVPMVSDSRQREHAEYGYAIPP